MAAILTVGSATVDEQLLGASLRRLQLGGVVTYAGAVFAEHGHRPTAVCNLSERWSEAVTSLMKNLGIGLFAGHTNEMTAFQNRVFADGEREQHLLSIAPPITPELVRMALESTGATHVHLGPLHGQDISTEAVRDLRSNGRTVSLDVQGLLRTSVPGPVRVEVASSLRESLAAATVVKVSAHELDSLLHALNQTVESLLNEYRIDEFVVTRGRYGGYVAVRHGRPMTFAAVATSSVSDPTGAGDIFFAEYLVARMYDGASISQACERAAAISGRQVAGNFIPHRRLSLQT